MRKIINVIICSFLYKIAICYTTYDQRQTGDLNIQVEVKDIQLFAFMKGNKEEYVDYDYAYDYSEMTIKPQHGSKPKPNVTSTVMATPVTNITSSIPIIEHTSEVGVINASNIITETKLTTYNNTNFNSTLQPSLLNLNESVGT